jgi:hypothetical protein
MDNKSSKDTITRSVLQSELFKYNEGVRSIFAFKNLLVVGVLSEVRIFDITTLKFI